MFHLVDREILSESPDISDKICNLELSPLLVGGLLVLVVHQHRHQSDVRNDSYGQTIGVLPVHFLVGQLQD